jgi:hypothetical protein
MHGPRRLLANEHFEAPRYVEDLFGGRLPLQNFTRLGNSRLEFVAHGGTARQWSSTGSWEWDMWNAGAEVTAEIVPAMENNVFRGVGFHGAAETSNATVEFSSGWKDEQDQDVLKLFAGVLFSKGPSIYVGMTHLRWEYENPSMEDKDHENHVQGLAIQNLELNLPYVGNMVFALGGSRSNKDEDERVQTASWCAGTYGGKGDLRFDLQHTGMLSRASTDRVNRFDFTALLNGRFTREDHVRRVAFSDGGMGDLRGYMNNVMDFHRDQNYPNFTGGPEFFRPALDLPDYTRTAGLKLETFWAHLGPEPMQYFTLDIVCYPLGIAEVASPTFKSPVPNWLWVGFGYHDRLKQWTGRFGVNLVPKKRPDVGARLEVEKREGSHPTVYLNVFLRFK